MASNIARQVGERPSPERGGERGIVEAADQFGQVALRGSGRSQLWRLARYGSGRDSTDCGSGRNLGRGERFGHENILMTSVQVGRISAAGGKCAFRSAKE